MRTLKHCRNYLTGLALVLFGLLIISDDTFAAAKPKQKCCFSGLREHFFGKQVEQNIPSIDRVNETISQKKHKNLILIQKERYNKKIDELRRTYSESTKLPKVGEITLHEEARDQLTSEDVLSYSKFFVGLQEDYPLDQKPRQKMSWRQYLVSFLKSIKQFFTGEEKIDRYQSVRHWESEYGKLKTRWLLTLDKNNLISQQILGNKINYPSFDRTWIDVEGQEVYTQLRQLEFKQAAVLEELELVNKSITDPESLKGHAYRDLELGFKERFKALIADRDDADWESKWNRVINQEQEMLNDPNMRPEFLRDQEARKFFLVKLKSENNAEIKKLEIYGEMIAHLKSKMIYQDGNVLIKSSRSQYPLSVDTYIRTFLEHLENPDGVPPFEFPVELFEVPGHGQTRDGVLIKNRFLPAGR